MNEREIKRNLNKRVKFTNRRLFVENADYILVGATIRRNDEGFFYQAILQDVNNGNSVVVCKLEEIAAGVGDGAPDVPEREKGQENDSNKISFLNLEIKERLHR